MQLPSIPEGDHAYLAPWLIKLLTATALMALAAALSWSQVVNSANSAHERNIAITQTRLEAVITTQQEQRTQLDRIEAKLDAVLIAQAGKRGSQ